jgi:hypothetical protein
VKRRDEAPYDDALVADDEPPVLDLGVVEDDEELAAVVDELVRRDVAAQQRLREVNALSEVLRRTVDADSWRLVLEIESRANERWADLLVTVARWAFERGRRWPLKLDGDDGSPSA